MSYYEAREHWIAYQKEKKIKHEHNKVELFATLSAASIIALVTILAFFIV